MAVNFRLQKKEDGTMSIIMEDKDGSGDLNKVMVEMLSKHRDDEKPFPANEAFGEMIMNVKDHYKATFDNIPDDNNDLHESTV